MEDCIFCQIVAGKIPSCRVYEDDAFLAFMDVFPRVIGHVLVIPKTHYRWVSDVPEFGDYWEAARNVGLKVQNATKAGFISYITMGEAVHHAHIHILPQNEGRISGISFTPVLKIPHEEIEKLAEQILQQII